MHLYIEIPENHSKWLIYIDLHLLAWKYASKIMLHGKKSDSITCTMLMKNKQIFFFFFDEK